MKFSRLSGLEYARTQKVHSIQKVETELYQMKATLSSTLREREEIEYSIEMLTSENETYYTCDTVPKDCCQVTF